MTLEPSSSDEASFTRSLPERSPQESFVDGTLNRTRKKVRGVEILGNWLELSAGVAVYLFLAVVLDQWLVSGGFDHIGRLVVLFGMLVAAGVFGYLRILPLYLRRVNPAYAAHTIEKNRSGLKNSLLNFVLLRSHAEEVHPRVLEEMSRRAAEDLSRLDVDNTIDRSQLVRVAWMFLGIVVALAGYKLFSPKDPFLSVARILFPWSQAKVPTRVVIEQIEPGSCRRFLDQTVQVRAVVKGLRGGEEVTLHYSSPDGSVLGKPLPMREVPGDYRRQVELPDEGKGLRQDLEYWITAGDCQSERFKIQVAIPPSIVVKEVEYHYPAYTNLAPRKTQRQGDLRALEGTEVVLTAEANQEIASAFMDLGSDGGRDYGLSIGVGNLAQVRFPLQRDAQTGKEKFNNYQLRFTNREGDANPQPTRHKIEVIPDQVPEIRVVNPSLKPEESLILKEGASVNLIVEASDPDFQLSKVDFVAEKNAVRLPGESLLNSPRGGKYRRAWVLNTEKLGLKQGDEIFFWFEAKDNKQPTPNIGSTDRFRLVISSPLNKQEQQDQLTQAENQRDQFNRRNGNARGEQAEEFGPQEKNEKNENTKKEEQLASAEKLKKDPEARGSEEPMPRSDEKESKSGGGTQGSPDDSGSNSKVKNSSSNSDSESKDTIKKENDLSKGKEAEKKSTPKQEDDPEKKQNGDSKDSPVDSEKEKSDQKESKNLDSKEPESKQSMKKEFSDSPMPKEENPSSKSSSKSETEKTVGQKENQDVESKSEESQEQGESQPRIDPTADPGKAFEEIQKFFERKKEAEEQADPNPAEKKESEKQPMPGSEGSSAEKKKSEQTPAGETEKKEGSSQEGSTGSPDKKGGEKKSEKQPNPSSGQPDPNTKSGMGEKSEMKNSATPEKKSVTEQSKGDSLPMEPTDGEKGDGKNSSQEESPNSKSESKKGPAQKSGSQQEKSGGTAGNPGKPMPMQPKDDTPSQQKEKGSAQDKVQGNVGQGSRNEESQGTPSAKKQARPSQKNPMNDLKDKSKTNEPPGTNEKTREYDVKGQSSGDRAGDGKAGGGQKANRQGTGSTGQNTSSDEGGGASEESGKGATGSKQGNSDPGGKGNSNNPGESSSSPDGKGKNSSSSKEGEGDSGDSSGDSSGAENKSMGSKSGSATPSGKKGKPGGGGPQSGGGLPPQDNGAPSSSSPRQAQQVEEGDQANLEYARKATDLVLDRLKKQEPDPELLKRLNWTREDMERFVRRWEELKKAAEADGDAGEEARGELDRLLRGLGLRPRGSNLGRGESEEDNQRNLKQTRRTNPPSEYADQYRAFSSGTARAARDKDKASTDQEKEDGK